MIKGIRAEQDQDHLSFQQEQSGCYIDSRLQGDNGKSREITTTIIKARDGLDQGINGESSKDSENKFQQVLKISVITAKAI